MGWWFLWWIKIQCRSLQNGFAYPFCSENGLQWKIMILYHMVSGYFTLNLWFAFWGPGHSICRAQVNTTLGFPSDTKNWPFKKGLTKARRKGFELQLSDLYGSKNDLSVQLQIYVIGFEPNLSHFSSLKFLHKKHVFRSFWGLFGGGRSRFYKRLCTRVSLQNPVHDTSHPETRTSRIEPVLCDIVGERNSEHGFVELGWNLTIGQKEQEPSRMGYV